MTSQRYVIRDCSIIPGTAPNDSHEPNRPPYLLVTATTEELASSGRVAGQLQVSIANGEPHVFAIGKIITIAVH